MASLGLYTSGSNGFNWVYSDCWEEILTSKANIFVRWLIFWIAVLGLYLLWLVWRPQFDQCGGQEKTDFELSYYNREQNLLLWWCWLLEVPELCFSSETLIVMVILDTGDLLRSRLYLPPWWPWMLFWRSFNGGRPFYLRTSSKSW